MKRKSRYQWIVVRSKVNHERRAAANIEHSGIESYYPRWFDVSSGRIRPLFPTYLFARIKDGHFAPILSVRGVRGVVKFGDKPPSVPESVITELRSQEIDDGVIGLKDRFTLGQRLSIVGGGPFVEGLYVGMSSDRRVRVLFDLLGRQVETDIDIKRVRPG